MVRRTTARRLGLVAFTRCLPADPDDLVRVRSRVRYALHSRNCRTRRPRRCAAWSGCSGWSRRCCCRMPTSDLLLALERMAGANDDQSAR